MEAIVALLIMLVLAAMACGPIALIVAIVASSRNHRLMEELSALRRRIDSLEQIIQRLKGESAAAAPKPPAPASAPAERGVAPQPPKPEAAPIVRPAPTPPPGKPAWEKGTPPAERLYRPEPVAGPKPKVALEEKIGTRWILIAGVVTSFFGVAYFLKFAYDRGLIGPLGRTIIAAAAGLMCLLTGEVTRRRNYELVAKGVTALGFAILYATVFSACKWLQPPLIGMNTAFVLAAVITAGAMAYAVILDEVAIAALSLLGGFLSPVILSTGQNMPGVLFGYVLVLGGGACGCALFRRWRLINVLAFIGTWTLYAAWFAQFYISPHDATISGEQSQLAVATSWLAIFFLVYLVMPLLHGLVKRAVARREDVVLVVANATVVFGYLAKMLYGNYREWLAFGAVVMALAHIVMAIIVMIRTREDADLQWTLLTIMIVFVTMAIPLYFHTNAVVLAWASEAVVLVFIGLRYGSLWTQTMAVGTMILAVWKLVFDLPGHTESFTAVLNPTFGTWAFVVAALAACHILYRRRTTQDISAAAYARELYYCAAVTLLIMSGWQEWHAYYNYNTAAVDGNLLHGGDAILLAIGLLVAAIRPLRPAGLICNAFGGLVAACAAVYMLGFPAHVAVHIPAMVWAVAGLALVIAGFRFLCGWTRLLGAVALAIALGYLIGALPMHLDAFTPILNSAFASWCFVAAVAAICHAIYRRAATAGSEDADLIGQLYYCAVVAVLTTAASLEWRGYVELRHTAGAWGIEHGQIIILAAALLAIVIRPLRPRGVIMNFATLAIAAFAAMYCLAQFEDLQSGRFVMFLNSGFLAVLLLLAVGVFAARTLREADDFASSGLIARAIGFGLVVLLWLLISMEIYYFWYWRGQTHPVVENWRFMMQMCISISWAVYAAILTAVGFWRHIRLLRYMALGLFALLVAKVFIIDTSAIKNVYRMGAFLATGVVLVLVSYLYQFLKKKGFFEVGS